MYPQVRTQHIIAVCVVVIFSNSISAQDPLRCDLVWVQTSKGFPIPDNSVYSDGGTQLVAGALIPGKRIPTIGYVQASNGDGSFSYQQLQYNMFSYKILTNPVGCGLEWVPVSHSYYTRFAVEFERMKVGRALVKGTGDIVTGYITGNTLNAVYGESVLLFGEEEYTVLTSISKGLELKLTGFALYTPPSAPTLEMIGKDEIVNESEATAYQSITHSKNVTESNGFKSSFPWNDVNSLSINFCASTKCMALSSTISSGETMVIEKDTEITFTRTIEVPPFSSVEICSMVENVHNYETQWDAFAEFTFAGKTAEQVILDLKRKPSWTNANFEIFGNTAITTVSGSYVGSFVSSSKFIAGSAGSGVCS